MEFLLKQDVRRLKLNNHYFYQLLFTRVNLSLVHISCHDKKEHSRNRLLRFTKAPHVTPAVKHTRAHKQSAHYRENRRVQLAQSYDRRGRSSPTTCFLNVCLCLLRVLTGVCFLCGISLHLHILANSYSIFGHRHTFMSSFVI